MINRKHRFHGRSSLRFAYQRGETLRSSLFCLKCVANPKRRTYRMAVVVSRKVHKSAVVRNRIRRRIFETVRQVEDHINASYDLVFVVYSDQLATIEYAQVQTQILEQLNKAGILSDKKP